MINQNYRGSSEKAIEKFSKSENENLRMEHDSIKEWDSKEECKQPHDIDLATVLRLYLVGKEANLNKLMEKSEKQNPGDWKKSKYAYAISAMKTNIGMTKDCIDILLRVNDRICRYFSYINDSKTSFVIGKEADMNNQPNYFCLRSVDCTETKHECTKFFQQRSDEWFEVRKQAKVTASTMHTALGLRTLKEQQAHYDSILPSLFPKIKFKEVGCYVKWREDKAFLVASPGCEGDEGQTKRFLFEIKCPYKSDRKTNVSYSIPNNYVLQLITQMGASKECYGYHITESIFVSWSEESTTAFLVKFGEDLWNAIVAFLYGTHSRRPTKKRPKTKELKAHIDTFLKQNVKYLGEFKSVKAIQ
ncbi:unnamed protein product [Mytilus coruscus]|uniref:YqaJ viral recombinase domain-containing protein n=1 Tax=Mytilus coruscus TaxID=42192 RepID=A0A6J8CQD6_MYTCO|nr:unnamed protein product [Mytilus coruscus]